MKLCYIRENQIERSKSAGFIYRNRNKPQFSFLYPCPFVRGLCIRRFDYIFTNGKMDKNRRQQRKQ